MGKILAPVWAALLSMLHGLFGHVPTVPTHAGGLFGRLLHMGPVHGLLLIAVLAVVAYVVAGLVGKLVGTLARMAVIAAAVVLGYLFYVH